MTWMDTIYPILGVAYLIYSILCKDKITFFIRKDYKKSELTVINPNKYYSLQLKFAVLNSMILIIYGILLVALNLKPDNVFFSAGIIPFCIINFILVTKSKKYGYVDYKIGKTYK